jgi:hypothetical protein
MAASAAAVAANADSKCTTLIESLTEKYDIVIAKETEVVQGLFRYELFHVRTLATLYDEPIDLFDSTIHIELFDKDSDRENTLGFIQLKTTTRAFLKENNTIGNRPVFDVGLIVSKEKGLGRQLLYLAACLARRHNLPISLLAVPATNTRVGRNQEKLFEYYNSIGFARNGIPMTNPETGDKKQRYLSKANNVLLHFDPTYLGGRRTRRTRRHKKRSRKTRKH